MLIELFEALLDGADVLLTLVAELVLLEELFTGATAKFIDIAELESELEDELIEEESNELEDELLICERTAELLNELDKESLYLLASTCALFKETVDRASTEDALLLTVLIVKIITLSVNFNTLLWYTPPCSFQLIFNFLTKLLKNKAQFSIKNKEKELFKQRVLSFNYFFLLIVKTETAPSVANAPTNKASFDPSPV